MTRLLLANIDAYDDWIARAALRQQAFSDEAFMASRHTDAAEFDIYGTDAVIGVQGPLTYRYDMWSWYFGGTSYVGLSSKLMAAIANTNIERIVMVFDTPGGEVTGLPELARTIKDSPKPIVAVVDPCCASAGVWLASQASRIVSIESGEIGSLGVQCVAKSYTEALKQAGIDVQIFRAAISPEKNLAHPYEPLDDKAKAYLQDRVDRKGEQFVAAVAAGRGVTEAAVLEKFGQGRMLESAEALNVGFIDAVGSVASVLAEGTKKTVSATTGRRSAKLSTARSFARKF